MAMCSLFAVPSPAPPQPQPRPHPSPSPLNAPSPLVRFPPSKLRPPPRCPASASPSASTPAVEDGDRAPFSGCKTCGREEVERGCNGEGRIQGGIATVPGFGWWPIKAYRPCPGFVASGGRYFRQDQSMDEVVSGKGGRAKATTYAGISDGTDGKSEPSKTKRDPRRAKK